MSNPKNSNDNLNTEFIKSCARTLAFDLLRYGEHGGDMENITADKVYELLEALDAQQGVSPS